MLSPMNRILLLAIFGLLFAGQKLAAQIPNFCITKEEYRLYTLINEYRTKNGLSVIPISTSLCYVAKVHARDLYINNPDTSFCSLNSWSDKGQWNPCCHSRFTPSPVCIVNKPKELTKYPGEGHEIAYWDSENMVPDTVLKFWKSIGQTKELLLNQQKWSNFKWKAIGIGIYKGYACAWVGEMADTVPEPTICTSQAESDNMPVPFKIAKREIVSASTGRYYIIYGSFNTKEDAAKMVEKYQKEGFFQAKILVNDQKTFRVSLNDFATQQEALNAKNKLGNGYKEAWITKY
jgi:hypothetical protein